MLTLKKLFNDSDLEIQSELEVQFTNKQQTYPSGFFQNELYPILHDNNSVKDTFLPVFKQIDLNQYTQ